jgi:hypothetical protein
MRKLFTLFIFLISLSGSGQSPVDFFQYWFNDDISGAVSQSPASPSPSLTIVLEVPAGSLPGGLHALHIRFRNEERRWSSTLSRFFYKMPVSTVAGKSIRQYQYWFNNDRENSVIGETDGGGIIQLDETIDVARMPGGLHAFHIRFRDESGRWSSPLSRFFYKMQVSPAAETIIRQYQYWFNNDRENSVSGEASGDGIIQLDETVDVAGMPGGLHAFHIRFRDESGRWSSPLSRFFYRMPSDGPHEENLVKAYRYWFGEGDQNMFRVDLDLPVSPLHLIAEIETPYLEPGMHDLSIQFLDLNGKWSPVLSQEFEIENCLPRYIGEPEGQSEVCGGTTELYTTDAALNITGFEWTLSPPEAGTVIETGSSARVEWSSSFSGDAVLSVTGYNPCGETDAGSLAVSVVPSPSVKAMDDAVICEGESIALTVIESVGAIEWDTEDLLVSPLQETIYTVTATNFCGSAEDILVIGVDTYPSLSVMDDVAICQGEQIELVAASDGLVSWNSGATVVSPSSTTSYIVTAANNGCELSAEVTITVKEVPYLQVMPDPEICEGEELLLTAETDGTVTWSSGSAAFYPVESGFITAFAEKEGCIVQQELFVTVHPVPETPVLEQTGITLISNSASGNAWFFNGEEMEGVSGHEYSPEKEGDYYVQVISSMGCISEPSNIISFMASNLTKIDMSEFTVFPNPVNDELFIDPGSLRGEVFRLELMALDGTVLLVRKLTEKSHINLASLVPSVYLLRISRGDESRIFRVIKN